ncbi:MAG: PorP/SprF family type IX secretion system membrane protein [Flammeovirgaceae bacterium]|nr:PorP/SprF family type IX secretion system membrane protein [Flammeovirgaceae bacterium]MDW8288048.1 PorP/SprF family type IX secretion system membrane protein [Flammeovirgaceae bacterium]
MKNVFWTLLLVICYMKIKAQDVGLTQFFSSPIYLNPAFTGSVPQYRCNTAYRLQWSALASPLETNIFSFDARLANYNVGIGGIITHDRIASLGLSSTTFGGVYSYVTETDQWMYRWGIQAGVIVRSVQFSRLTFGDQFLTGSPVTKEQFQQATIGMPDVGAGFAAYSHRLWYGFAVHHLNQPDQSVISSTSYQKERLPARFSVHVGGKYALHSQYIEVLPALLLQHQGASTLFDISNAFRYSDFMLGFSYKTSLSKPSSQLSANRRAVAFFSNVKVESFIVGYSFDYGIGGNNAHYFGSTHELTVVFVPKASKRFKKKVRDNTRVHLPVYGFY